MKLNEYQEAGWRTMPSSDKGDAMQKALNISNYAMGLAGETGEIVDLLKKHIHHGHELDRAKAKAELGDVLHYLSGLSTMLGFSLEDVATANIDKLQKRYPNGFSETDSINRKG